jgi:hypothetical protein
MNLKEVIKNIALTDQALRNDSLGSEFQSYTVMWVKTNMPEVYKELQSNFEHIRPEVYAAQQFDPTDPRF